MPLGAEARGEVLPGRPLPGSSVLPPAQTGTAKVSRAFTRLQGKHGLEAVLMPALQGGRLPEEENLWTPWQHAPEPERARDATWEGRLPAPQPLLLRTVPAALLDSDGRDIGVSLRYGLMGRPRWLSLQEGPSRRDRTRSEVRAWSRSWPVESHWWDPGVMRRLARLQVLLDDGRGLLLYREDGRWQVAGCYE